MKLTIGTRGSKLALAQARWVQAQLERAGCAAEIHPITTSGDKLTTASLAGSGVKGLFVKEIEEALLDGRIDLAVHSMKDLPVNQPAGLSIAAVPEREDARDVLLTRSGVALADLPPGARIATSSLRREAQLREMRRDLNVRPIRGNLDTRITKMMRGDCDALAVAAAGMHRLGLEHPIAEYFHPERCCPAPGQGALAIETRSGDARAELAAKLLDDSAARRAILAERAALRSLGGGCQTPIGAYATLAGDRLRIIGMLAAADGSSVVRAVIEGASDDPETTGEALAHELLRDGTSNLRS